MDENVIREYRQKIRTIGYAISQIDQATDNIADQRFQLEFYRRHPEVGVRNGETVASPEKSLAMMRGMEKERRAFVEILLYYTSTETEEEARAAYLRLLAVYQRFAKLREQEQMVAAGFTMTEMENRFDGDLESELKNAYERVVEANEQVGMPDPSVITLGA